MSYENDSPSGEAPPVPIHGPQAGFKSVDEEVTQLPPITVESIHPPEAGDFSEGDAVIVLQVNGKDNRDAAKGEVGLLIPEAARQEEEITASFLSTVLASLSPEEQATVDIMVLASSASLETLDGVASDHKRAVETGEHAIVGFKKALAGAGLSDQSIVNCRGEHNGVIFETDALTDVPFLHDASEAAKAYREEMVKRYGTGFQAWAAYEKDKGPAHELRKQHGVRGHAERADDVAEFLQLSQDWMETYRETYPDRRLILWSIGHYDSLSPYLKQQAHVDVGDTILPMDKLSGVTVHQRASQQP